MAVAALSKVYATRGGNFAAGACARMYNRLESSRLVGPPSVAFPIGSASGPERVAVAAAAGWMFFKHKSK